MLTKKQLEKGLNTCPLVVPRLQTLQLAEKINPQFHRPHIIGGFLRNIALGVDPNDCDVVFQGFQLNQPGILEAVREAEKRLRVEPYPDWDFENAMATGLSNDFFEDTIGKYSHLTDYLTMLLLNTDGTLSLGEEKTLSDIDNRIFDLRFSGVEIWVNHRGKGRSYASCLIGDLIRALYLSTALNLTPSPIVVFLLSNFDHMFNSLTSDDQEKRRGLWLQKTKGDPKYQPMLNRFNIKALKT